jgi:cysteine desulfurase
VIAEQAPRIATIGAVSLPGGSSASLLVQLDLAGIAVSAGSACSSGKMKSSDVLSAMKVPGAIADAFIRVSFGPDTREADIERFLEEWRRIAAKAPAKAA